jgi:hypothetical protein
MSPFLLPMDPAGIIAKIWRKVGPAIPAGSPTERWFRNDYMGENQANLGA